MERIRMAALTQDDDKLMQPMINNIGNEVWKSKEAKLFGDESAEMNLGDDLKRGYLMEAVAAVTFLLSGSDLVILRHPETVKLVRGFIDKMVAQVAEKKLGVAAAKKPQAAAAPRAAPKPQAAAPKPQAAAAPPKPEAKPQAAAPAPEGPKEEKVVDIAAAKKEKEAEAAKAEEKARAEAKAKAEAAAEAKAEAEAAAKREARDAAKAEREAAEAELKAKRAAARTKHAAAGGEADEEEDRENLVISPKPRNVAGPDAIFIERKLYRVSRGPIVGH